MRQSSITSLRLCYFDSWSVGKTFFCWFFVRATRGTLYILTTRTPSLKTDWHNNRCIQWNKDQDELLYTVRRDKRYAYCVNFCKHWYTHRNIYIYMPVHQTTYRNKNISNTTHTNKILIINIYKNKNDETKSYFISDSSCMRICKRN